MTLLQKIKEIDVKTSHFFPKFYHHKLLSNTMKFIAGIGDFGMVWLLLILILSLSNKTQLLSQKMLTALLLATIIGQVTIKSIIKRKRPCHTYDDVEMLVAIPSDYSFPSGHTTSSFACATTVCFFFPKTGLILILFAFLMAFSRLYLFVHYLSDVTFGMILGISVGIIVMLF
ncbi:phosphatase PAP2 family protein [Thomasclavelia sp.]